MRYADGDGMRMALEQRLRNEAEARGVALLRLRKRVAFERFLARLASAPAEWVLKGAFALELRLGLQTRMTKDIDLARDDDEAAVTRDLVAAAALDAGDFFTFRVRRTPALERAVDFRAVRYSVTSELAGRRFEQFPLDVGLVEAPALSPDVIETEGSLVFADIALPPLAVIAIEQHIAEKVHAYTATHGTDGRGSTRVKDLVDLVLIARHASPRAERLQQALRSTFERYGRQPLPDTLPPPPDGWIAPYAQLARDVGLPVDLVSAHAEAGALVDPILQDRAVGAWEVLGASWRS
ncbi:MAG TPA: nucleotidyl transferase AbiEii/AbiGii toxin family protein [Conexibacter sp.]|nr:nucleotidyl transferase AbiEii/AbiGii toxin family protein [Conexibacter sp.]